MKKRMALLLAALMLLTSLCALAEEEKGAPIYATVGEAIDDSFEGRVISGGIPGEYYAVLNLKDGKYYRSVAYYDETLTQLEAAVDGLDYEADDFFEKHEAAMQAVDDYIKTLPIAYSEVFTAEPLTDEEMAAFLGKTIAELNEAGFETGSHGTEPGDGDEPIIVYTMRYGVYDYNCLVDADFDTYMEATENDTDGELVVSGIALAGITEWAFDLRYHTDGTVEAPVDPFAEFSPFMEDVGAFVEKVQAGEEVNIDDFATEMKEKYPDYEGLVDMYVTLYKTLGAEGFLTMMQQPAE